MPWGTHTVIINAFSKTHWVHSSLFSHIFFILGVLLDCEGSFIAAALVKILRTWKSSTYMQVIVLEVYKGSSSITKEPKCMCKVKLTYTYCGYPAVGRRKSKRIQRKVSDWNVCPPGSSVPASPTAVLKTMPSLGVLPEVHQVPWMRGGKEGVWPLLSMKREGWAVHSVSVLRIPVCLPPKSHHLDSLWRYVELAGRLLLFFCEVRGGGWSCESVLFGGWSMGTDCPDRTMCCSKPDGQVKRSTSP